MRKISKPVHTGLISKPAHIKLPIYLKTSFRNTPLVHCTQPSVFTAQAKLRAQQGKLQLNSQSAERANINCARSTHSSDHNIIFTTRKKRRWEKGPVEMAVEVGPVSLASKAGER